LQECDGTLQVFSFGFCLVNKILGEDFYFSNIKVYNWQLGLTNRTGTFYSGVTYLSWSALAAAISVLMVKASNLSEEKNV